MLVCLIELLVPVLCVVVEFEAVVQLENEALALLSKKELSEILVLPTVKEASALPVVDFETIAHLLAIVTASLVEPNILATVNLDLENKALAHILG